MKRKRLFEAILVILVIATLFIGLSLLSYSVDDPSYSTIVFSRYPDQIHNIFGKAGAYAADFFSTALGWSAFLIPFGMIYTIVQLIRAYRKKCTGVKSAGGITFSVLLVLAVSVLSGIVSDTDPFIADKMGGGIFGAALAGLVKGFIGKTGGMIFLCILTVFLAMGVLRISVTDLAGKISEMFEAGSDKLKKSKDKKEQSENREGPSFLKRKILSVSKLINDFKAKQIAKKAERDKRLLDELENKPVRTMAPETDEERVAEVTDNRITEEINDKIEIAPPLIIPQFQVAEDETPAEDSIDSFDLPDKDELLTVSKLEKLFEERDRRVGNSDINDIFDDLLVLNTHRVEKAPSSVKNIVTGANYELPFSLLDAPDPEDTSVDQDSLRFKADLLLGKLKDFGIDGRIREIRPGPVVTLFELEPAPGIKISRISNLENDLALAMSALSIRIIAPIPGKAAVGIEIPNEKRITVKLRELLETKDFKQNSSPLVMALGKDISGKPYFADLRSMPHLLVAGATGSGKSVCINTIICSILYKSSPDAVKFVMIDPKMVELNVYNGIPHLAAPVVTDTRKAAAVLNNVVREMENRYRILSECGVRNIESYSSHIKNKPEMDPMPYMVVIVDEFGDLMMVAGKEVETAIIRIAQLARAVGIHLVLATQRPSVNVITGVIKANMPARISFRVASKIDSRTILDQNGAELLLGRGDSLFIPPGTGFSTRVHGCFVSEDDVRRIVDDLKRYGEPVYDMALLEEPSVDGGFDNDDLDPRYDEALKLVKEKGEASISMIQRYLRVGYNKAARIIESMERRGLIAPSDGTSKPRKYTGDD